MVFSALVIIFLFLKWWGQVPILRSLQYVTFKYGDFQKASRISLREPSKSINSIVITHIFLKQEVPKCFWKFQICVYVSIDSINCSLIRKFLSFLMCFHEQCLLFHFFVIFNQKWITKKFMKLMLGEGGRIRQEV